MRERCEAVLTSGDSAAEACGSAHCVCDKDVRESFERSEKSERISQSGLRRCVGVRCVDNCVSSVGAVRCTDAASTAQDCTAVWERSDSSQGAVRGAKGASAACTGSVRMAVVAGETSTQTVGSTRCATVGVAEGDHLCRSTAARPRRAVRVRVCAWTQAVAASDAPTRCERGVRGACGARRVDPVRCVARTSTAESQAVSME